MDFCKPLKCTRAFGATLVLVAACGKPKNDLPPPPPPPNLTSISFSNGVSAWMSLNNTFTHECERDQDRPDRRWKRYPREGILIHLGKFTDPPGTPPDDQETYPIYNSTRVDGDPYVASDGLFWIDVVADFTLPPGEPEPGKRNPMEKESGPCLYPNGATNCACYGDAACCSRRLHPLLDPQAVITFWGGSKDYHIVATQTPPAKMWQVRHKIELEADVEVIVYRHQAGTDPPVFDVVKTYPKGRHTILVESTEPMQHGQGLDPPWP